MNRTEVIEIVTEHVPIL